MQIIFADESVRNGAVFLLGQALGMGGHWAVKWLNKEVDCIADMMLTEPRRTIASVIAQALAALTALGTGVVNAVPLMQAFGMGVAGGGCIDAFVNRGRRRKWTDDQRRERDKTPQG